MNRETDNFLQKFFQTSRLEEADVTAMEQLVRQYPYYAPLQYILAKKYRQVNNDQYQLQLTKTAVFFSNPHWLNDLLLSDEAASYEDDFANAGAEVREPAEEILPPQSDVVPGEDDAGQPIDNELNTEPKGGANENRPGDHFELVPPVVEAGEDPFLAEQGESEDEAPIPSFNKEAIPGASQAGNDTEPVPNAEIIPAELQEEIEQEIPESFPEAIYGDEAAEKPAELVETGPDIPEEHAKENDTVIAHLAEEVISGSNSVDAEQEQEKNSPAGEPDVDAGEVNAVPEKPEAALPVESLSGNLVKSGSPSSSDPGNVPLVPIEPLYAVDYFASQGIKLKDEDGKDKLSQKLRSFTEWLKTMKRIHPEKLEEEMDSQTSTVIQHIAEHSNELEDVVTEAMAEVYARQGLRSKAAEVYQKLSLLNPNKRAYFAARISKLNET
ncbi:hypothetical protein [Agriterribacter sp.]|uniref:hypothetical protein n=1 Tax=Agriterribacter sp. TaxID=2821509 RepID=UPI002CCF74B4|nr:hypothetical protein [Agriterribacter sp.]HRP56510.1 hypothetical protein [Agriterribacter sp.]